MDEAFFDRLLAEREELKDKMEGLEKFLKSIKNDPSDLQSKALMTQLAIMVAYENILIIRIDDLSEVNPQPAE